MYSNQSIHSEMNHILYKFLQKEVKLNRKKTSQTVKAITKTVQEIVQFINTKDKRFQREVKCTGSYYQGLKVKRADEFDFNIYLDGFDSLCQWGSGTNIRNYRFNKDYSRESDIYVNLAYEFYFSTTFMPVPIDPYQGINPLSYSQTQRIKPAYLQSPQMVTTSPSFDPNCDPVDQFRQDFRRYMGPPMDVKYQNQRSLPAPGPTQGPHLPSGLPVDIDNLDTLPDDMEIIRSSTPLPEPPLGYCFFGLYIPPSWHNSQEFVYDQDIIPFYVQRKFKKLLQQALRELPNYRGNVRLARKVHGPALTLRIPTTEPDMPEVSIDFAVTIPTKLPIPNNSRITDWPRAGKYWPSKAKIDAINKAGINFVAKKPYYWLISFGAWEKELIDGIDMSGEECRKDCHRIMKRIREKFWCTTTKPAISSYHLKNILFWECEDFPTKSDWTQNKIWERFQSMTKRLLGYMDTMKLPHYFNSRINLLEGKNKEVLQEEKQKIVSFMLDPVKYLSK